MAQFYSAKRRVTTRQIITVTVNDLDPFGQGVARHQGKALFISGLLPQEQADVVVVEDKKQYARAQVKRRLSDSPQRQAPRCPHFGICGGCQQQHASIELQQQSKRAALARLMKRDVDDIIAASPWGYRRRARLSLNYQPKSQQLQMGFRKANASEIVDVVQCPVLVPTLGALLPAVRECLSELKSVRQLGHVELVQADNGPLMVLRHTAALPAADKEKLERFSQSHGLSLYLAPQSEILEHIRGEAPWYTSDGLRLVFSPRDFIQVNDGVNQLMVRTALEWLDIQPQDRVLDLFCGMGNFTLPLAKPQPLAGQTFTFSTYDPTYYVDMYYDKDADFTLPTAMKTSCSAKVMTPKPNEKMLSYAQSLDKADAPPEDMELGNYFAQKVTLQCQ